MSDLWGQSCEVQAASCKLWGRSCEMPAASCKLQSHQNVSAPHRIGPIDQQEVKSSFAACSLQLAKHSHERVKGSGRGLFTASLCTIQTSSCTVVSLLARVFLGHISGSWARSPRTHTQGSRPRLSLGVPDVCLPLTPPRPQHPHTSLSPRATATTSVSVTVYGSTLERNGRAQPSLPFAVVGVYTVGVKRNFPQDLKRTPMCWSHTRHGLS